RMPGRGVEHVHGSKSAATGPAVRSHPARLGAWSRTRQLGRNRMTISGDALAAHVFEIMLLPILQVQRATIAIVHGGSDVGSQLLLQRSEEHTSELQSRSDLVCRLLLEKKKPNDVWSVPS